KLRHLSDLSLPPRHRQDGLEPAEPRRNRAGRDAGGLPLRSRTGEDVAGDLDEPTPAESMDDLTQVAARRLGRSLAPKPEILDVEINLVRQRGPLVRRADPAAACTFLVSRLERALGVSLRHVAGPLAYELRDRLADLL